MLNDRVDLLNDYPFQRLTDLIGGAKPRANLPPIVMSLGEPQHQPPAFVAGILARHADKWNKYPPLNGTPELRAACAGWLNRRFGLPEGWIDPETQIAPVAGTREGLFIIALLAVGRADGGPAPVALMPNPFYQVYLGAAVMAGAEPLFLPAVKATGFLPDLDAVDAATLARTRILYLCNPGNPQGAVAGIDYLKRAIALARRHDFLLVVDECYTEIYSGDVPPPGVLEAARAVDGGSLANVVAFHSLSKRSNAAGLRSGFAVGAKDTIARLNRLRSYSCASTPLPAQHAAAALWNDDGHAVATRAYYRANFDAAERNLAGRFGLYRPGGGFFLWLDIGDGERAARRLWTEAAIRTLPGAYLTRPDTSGFNSGAPYLRIALVHDLETVEAALQRIARTL